MSHPQHSHHGPGLSIQSVLKVFVLLLFVFGFIVQPHRIPSASMQPSLLVGDFLLVNKQQPAPAGHWGGLLPYRTPKRGDVVIFYEPRTTGTLLVKRVEATEGDRIALHAGTVLLNGTPQHEPYAIYSPGSRNHYRDDFPNLQNADPDADALWWIELRRRMSDGTLPVPKNDVFVMGDNRNDSLDSRYWGFVPRENVVGEPLLVYFSAREPLEGNLWQRIRHAARWRRTITVVR